MPLAQKVLESGTWYPFTPSNLDLVPQAPGVYWLGVPNEIIYIGSAGNLHQRLTDHYYTDDACIAQATQFAIGPCLNYKEREKLLLRDYLARYGSLPRCNDRI